jgi:hypothetical protein
MDTGIVGELLAEVFRQIAETVAMVLFMVVVGERLVQFLEPIFKPALNWMESTLHLPDGWSMMVFSWIVVGLVVAATEANVFAPFIPRPWIGQLLTVIFCGGGSNMLHDVWPSGKKTA